MNNSLHPPDFRRVALKQRVELEARVAQRHGSVAFMNSRDAKPLLDFFVLGRSQGQSNCICHKIFTWRTDMTTALVTQKPTGFTPASPRDAYELAVHMYKSQLTVDQIINLRPCGEYDRDRLKQLWSGRESLSLNDIASLDIPRDDVWWVIVKLADNKQRRHLACWCALQVLPDGAHEVIRNYLESYGRRQDIRFAAMEAAWAAANNAARVAAWNVQIAYAIKYIQEG